MNRALRVAWPALTIVVALAAAILGSALAPGGSSALLSARAAVLAALALAVAGVLGAVITAAGEPDAAARGRLLDAAAVAAALWTVVAAATAFLLYLEQAPAIGSPAFGPGLVTFVLDIGTGRAWLIAASFAAVLTALLIAVRTQRGTVLVGGAAVIAAVPIALQSAMSGDPLAVERSVVASGLVQLVALSAWIGAVALRPGRILPVVAFGAVALGVGASLPASVADGAVTPLALVGAAAVGVAGVLAAVAVRIGPRLREPQLLLLGVGIGLGVAASVTRSMSDVAARVTPAEILTGSPLPAPPSFVALLTSWQPDALWLVVAAALLVAYPVVVRRASTPWPTGRSVSWVVGLVLLVWLTSGGPAVYGAVLVAPRLAQLTALLLVVPLLLAGGAPLRLLAAAFPSRSTTGAPGPVPALVLVLVVPVLLLGTGLLRWSVSDSVGTEVTIAVCLVAGSALVRAVGVPGVRRRRAVLAAVLLLVAETVGAVALGSNGALLAADWYGAMGWGTDALAAQRAAAPVVWPIAALPTIVLLVTAIRSPGRPATALTRTEAVTA